MKDFFQRYLLPGFVFEAAVIGGGYATGRELVEFFLPAGPLGGLLGMVVSMVVWSAVLRARLTGDPRSAIGREATVIYTHRTIAGALREARLTHMA